MKKVIVLAGLIALIISLMTMTISVLTMKSCHEASEIPPDPFTTTWSFGEEGRTFSISGNSIGHAACKPSEFQITLDNRSGDNTWRGRYCILLINREEIVEEIAHEEFNVQARQEMQKPLTVTFPADVVKGSIGLCVFFPQRASVVTTLWVGEKRTESVGTWPDITTCPYFLTEEGSKNLADDFVSNRPTFVFDGIEESLVLEETVCLLKENKPGSQETLSKVHGWSFTFKFESTHSGYGDRSGQILAQVITPHEAIITVEAGEVTSAIMDGEWDMINQRINQRILNIQQYFDHYLGEVANKSNNQPSPQVFVYSEKLGVSYEYPSGSKEMPFHIASIGKTFTATLISMLAERGVISFDDPIICYLPDTSLENLFFFEGKDYAEQVTIKELLSHTSGVADFFEDPVIKGIPFAEDIINNPGTFWTPDTLLDFSRHNQKSVGKPGDVFHYSDTGYILLGKIIEEVTGKPFHVNLHDEFFVPLGMNDSYLMFHSEPANQPKKPIQKIWLNDTEVSQFTSLSSDWAGGGIVSTTADLLKFHQALRNGQLISHTMLEKMESFDNEFMPGIDYGLGMMEINFGDFSPVLDNLPQVTGNIGIWGTHMFYDRTTDTYINMNFGSSSHMGTSFEVLIEIMNVITSLRDRIDCYAMDLMPLYRNTCRKV